MSDDRKKHFRPGYANTEKLGGQGLPPNVKPPPTHAVCIECKQKHRIADMISDNEARWRCNPCAEKLLGA